MPLAILLLAASAWAGAGSSLPAGSHLSAEMRRRLPLVNSSDADAVRALERGIDDMLRSPTARSLAERFVAADLIIPVALENVDLGQGARGAYNFRFARATVSCRYGSVWTMESFAPILAHEVLGHALKHFESLGGGRSAMSYWEGEEEFAYLVSWLILAERGAFPGYVDDYLADPAGFLRLIGDWDAGYRVYMTYEELLEPRKALAARKKKLRREIRSVELRVEKNHSWDHVIEHQLKAHGLPNETMAQVRADQSFWDDRLKRLKSSLELMERSLKSLSDPQVQSTVVEAARAPLIENTRREIELMRRRLKELRTKQPSRGERPAAAPAFSASALDWDGLRALRDWDRREHPGGGH